MFQFLLDASPTAAASVSSPDALLVVVLVLLIGAGGVWFWMSQKHGGGSDWDAMEREKTRKAWKEIEELVAQNSSMGRKLAIIEADKLLDTCLRRVGFPGETFAERLKVAEYQHPALRMVWTPHKWRNQLVHEAHFTITDRQVRESLKLYRDALRALKAV